MAGGGDEGSGICARVNNDRSRVSSRVSSRVVAATMSAKPAPPTERRLATTFGTPPKTFIDITLCGRLRARALVARQYSPSGGNGGKRAAAAASTATTTTTAATAAATATTAMRRALHRWSVRRWPSGRRERASGYGRRRRQRRLRRLRQRCRRRRQRRQRRQRRLPERRRRSTRARRRCRRRR